MNILFVTENQVSQRLGGTDRITITLAEEFSRMGHACYLAYCRPGEAPDLEGFRETALLQEGDDEARITALIQAWKVDIVVCNLVGIRYKRKYLPLLFAATRGTSTRVVACYHAMPGEDLLGNRIGNSLYRIRKGGKIGQNLKDIALTILGPSLVQRLSRKRIQDKYRLMYRNSDALVLHTPEACRAFAEIAGLRCDARFDYVYSALTYDTFLDERELSAKKKVALIVARLDEKPKRISFALRAWRLIEAQRDCSDWQLKIVGGGPDAGYYQRMAKRLKLKNVSFEGRVPDLTAYYREASLFLLTSSYEGWALTLTESQQFGVVPVALDSYVSLPTILTNHENGVTVPDGDLKGYVAAVTALMRDPAERERLARNGLVSCRRFTREKVAEHWISLFGALRDPKISLVICTYNREEFIGRTLEKIAACHFPPERYEIVVVDNNSTDSTSEICAAFAAAHPEVNYRYALETSQGLSFARNTGISLAQGDYIVFLDDDSFVAPDYLERLSARLAAYPDADAFGGRIDPLFESGTAPRWLCKWTLSWVSAINRGGEVSRFSGSKYPIGANMGFKAQLLKEMPGFDTTLGRTGKNLLGGEEKEIFGRIAAAGGQIYYFPDVRVQHVIPERRTTRDYIVRFARGIGYSEFVRCRRKGAGALLKRRFSELVKWGATLVLWVGYLFRGRPACGNALVLFRWNVSCGLFFHKSLEG